MAIKYVLIPFAYQQVKYVKTPTMRYDNYKAFINSIKQFEYEEKIYDKYLTHDDLQIMKSFPEKLYKYFGHLYAFKMKKKLNI